MSKVIREKFTPDMRLLIHKYARIVMAEKKHQEKMEEEINKNKK